VIDGTTLRPLPEVLVHVFRWDPRISGFRVTDKVRTDGWGTTHFPTRISDELEAVVVYVPGAWARARCFRPLAGQQMRLHIRIWSLKESVISYTWKQIDTLRAYAALTGFTSGEILKRNGMKTEKDLKVGKAISLPCWAASVWLEPGETLESMAKTFAYGGVKELVKANGAKSISDLEREGHVRLPDWNFFYARKDEALPKIDRLFGVPLGSSRTVGRVHHPDARVPFESETIAVPTKAFRKKNSKYF